MHTTPDTVLMLHNVRQRELQDEAAYVWTARQNCARGVPPHGSITMTHRLRAAFVRTGAVLRDRCTWRPGSPLRPVAGRTGVH